MNIDGYTLFRKDRKDENKKRGGGVALFIKNDINVTHREELVEALFPENIWCNICCTHVVERDHWYEFAIDPLIA